MAKKKREISLWHKIPAFFVALGGTLGALTFFGVQIPQETHQTIFILAILSIVIIWFDHRLKELGG